MEGVAVQVLAEYGLIGLLAGAMILGMWRLRAEAVQDAKDARKKLVAVLERNTELTVEVTRAMEALRTTVLEKRTEQ